MKSLSLYGGRFLTLLRDVFALYGQDVVGVRLR